MLLFAILARHEAQMSSKTPDNAYGVSGVTLARSHAGISSRKVCAGEISEGEEGWPSSPSHELGLANR